MKPINYKIISDKEKALRITLVTIAITCIIQLLWQLLEIKVYGKTMPNDIDTIIGFILYVSIFINVYNYYEYKYQHKVVLSHYISIMKDLEEISKQCNIEIEKENKK